MAFRLSFNRRAGENFSTAMVAGIVVVALTAIGFTVYNATFVQGTATNCFITDKSERNGSKGKKIRKIHTEGCNGSPEPKILSVNINLAAGNGRGTVKDMFSEIEVGKTYDFETRGSEVSFLDVYENVVAIKK